MCCLFGLLDYSHQLKARQKNRIISVLSRECEVRGTDATGIAYLHRGNLAIYKRPLPAHRMKLRIPSDSPVVMGHTRLTTQGSERLNYNNHPFRGHIEGTPFTLAHNGILRNDKELRISEKLPSTNIQTDSYIAVQLLEQQKALDFGSLKQMAEQVDGSFVFTVLDESGSLYFVKGDNPLCIYHFTQLGFYLYASTEVILKRAVKRLGLQSSHHTQIKLSGGDILKLDANGKESQARFEYDPYRFWKYEGSYLGGSLFRDAYDEGYWEELRDVSCCFGYRPDDIDRFQRLGYPPDLVEEMFYCGEAAIDPSYFNAR